MKTKLNCNAGWHTLDLEELTQQSSRQIEACRGDKQQNYSGDGNGAGKKKKKSLSQALKIPEALSQCVHLFIQQNLLTSWYELAPS